MKQTKPTKKETRSGKSALLKTKLQRELYGILHLLEAPFLAVFWWLEKRLARLQGQLESDGAR
jgi:hypothetical protein